MIESIPPTSSGELSPEQTQEDWQNVDERIKAGLEEQGWQCAGQEYPIAHPLDMTTGRFDPKVIMTPEEITRKYLVAYGQYGFDQVRIETSHNIQTGRPNESMVYVYMRRPDEPQS